jgi:phage tail sheath protein FI
MAEYLAPGVYVEEIETGPRPIEGVSTSTTGMVGQTERGPTVPRLITSWEEYTRWYGDYIDRVPGGTDRKYLPYAVKGFFDNNGQRVFVARIVRPGATAASLNLSGSSGNTLVAANGPGAWGKNIMVRIQTAALAVSTGPTANWFRLTLLYYRDGIPSPFVDPTNINNFGNPNRKDPDVAEDYDNLSILPTDSNYAQSVINSASKLIVLTANGRPDNVDFPNAVLGGENDGTGEPTETEYQGSTSDPVDKQTGLLGLSRIRDISILAIPDEVVLPNLRNDIIQQCETLKDRFAILFATDAEQSSDFGTLRPPLDSTYGAYYMPWVRVLASHTVEGHLLVPAQGHLAGIYARVDDDRGVHKAPANEVIQGIITQDLGNNAKPLALILDKGDQDVLNPKGVNVIRDFRADGRGIRVWGARTMTSDPLWRYVNVRRLFIFMEVSIDRGSQWAVFEPNYEDTWASIRLSISSFLRTLWRNGALMGTSTDEAFFVKCDRTTMLQDDFDNGRLICLIGVAPTKPAEFVIFRISQKTLDATTQ